MPATKPTHQQQAIAIVAMVGRFPGAADVATLWSNVLEGREGITFFRDEELDPAIPETVRRDPAYVKAKGVITECDRFDAAFFGISPLEAKVMDPQHRVLLELAWSALETSGHRPSDLDGRVGVFVGANWDRYRKNNVASNPDVWATFGDFNTALANEQDFLATRIAYKLDLKGPACTVSTACSTSLVAITQAARALAAGECDLALAGGVSISVPIAAGYVHEPSGMLSRDGHCRPFDADCSGTTFNDGAGIVVLRRLDDAIADGDDVLAVIRGFAVNNDGADKVSFTAPSVAGQATVLSAALADAGVDPATVGYVETHGTATPMGDPIEFAALVRAYRGARDTGPPCAIGSVKSAVGHLVHAAGVTGFMMAVMAVQKGIIPPTLHFRSPNPRLGLERSRFHVASAPQQWPAAAHPRRAGVSSFGVGGTNAHVIVEQPPTRGSVDQPPPASCDLLCLAARDDAALQRTIDAMAEYLSTRSPHVELAALAWNLQNGRTALRRRAAIAVDSLADAANALSQRSRLRFGDAAHARGIVFQFPGHGSQRPGMGRCLYEALPVFRQIVDAGLAALTRTADRITGADDVRVALLEATPAAERAMADLRTGLPALLLYECALAATLEDMGVIAEAVIGCSLGEYAAAVHAGAMSLADALRTVSIAADAAAATPVGSMLTAFCSEAEAGVAVAADVAVAGVHAADVIVLSGSIEAIEQARLELTRRRVATRPLPAERAFHSPQIDSVTARLEDALANVVFSVPARRVVSCATGCELSPEEATDPAHWATVLRRPMYSSAALAQLGDGADHVLVEVGPGCSLTALALQHADAGKAVPIAAQPAVGIDVAAIPDLRAVLAHCWATGGMVDLTRRWAGARPPRMSLPTYRFDRTRHWLEAKAAAPDTTSKAAVVAAAQATPVKQDSDEARIAKVLTGASGLEIAAIDPKQWAELGFDSLVITQVAIGIRREFDIALGFRELMEQHTSPLLLLQWLRGQESSRAVPTAPVKPAALDLESQPATTRGEPPVRRPNPGARIERKVSEAFQLDARQRSHLDAFLIEYAQRTRSSKAFAQRHRGHLADPRAVSGFHPLWKEIVYPIVTERSNGSRLWDLDGNEYIDFLNGFGCIFFGHSPDFLTSAVSEQLGKGIEVGPQTALAGEVAELFCQLTGNDRVSFSNTGSEAVAGALRVARTVTGRDKVVIFEGSYHGIFDEVVLRSGPRGLALPGSPGIPRSHTEDVVILPYGVDESLQVIERMGRDLAAVLVEPVQSRRPELQPVAFLRQLRDITSRCGTALILDEVVTGFRTHPGGIQALFDVRADMAIYGKVVGGGHPIGLIAGRREFLDALDGGHWQYGDESVPEVGVTFFAGTFVRHPVALASARAVLRRLLEAGPSLQADLGRRTSAMVGEIQAFLARVGARVRIESFQSIMYISADTSEIWNSLLFAKLRHNGIHVGDHFPCFLTTSHSDADLVRFKTAFCNVVTELIEYGFLTGRIPDPDAIDLRNPPVPGARLGRRQDGTLAWYVPDPERAGKFREVKPTRRG